MIVEKKEACIVEIISLTVQKSAPIRPGIKAMKGDSRTQLVQFTLPRKCGELDLSELSWSIKVVNPCGIKDRFPPHEDISISDESIVFKWLVFGVATAVSGEGQFQVIGTDETAEGKPIVWQSGLGVIIVDDSIDDPTSNEYHEQISEIDRLIVYAREELPKVAEATRAANVAAVQANALFDLVYPVGAIYVSVNAISPEILFKRGRWERITDTFLLAAGSTFVAGTTGGEAEHMLSVEEMPQHRHTEMVGSIVSNQVVRVYSESVSTNYQRYYKSANSHTGFVGGGVAHNNMPPYLAVYMWKRTA